MSKNLVKVWNDNFHPYRENFEEQEIIIQANRFILMDYEKAVMFLGKISRVEVDGGGTQLPQSYKNLRIETMKDTKIELGKIEKLKCIGCSFIALNEEDFENHITEMHLDQLIDKEEYKKRLKKAL